MLPILGKAQEVPHFLVSSEVDAEHSQTANTRQEPSRLGVEPKLYTGGFEEMLADLRGICSTSGDHQQQQTSSADLMPKLNDNAYFEALRSVLVDEKRKFGQTASQLANSLAILIGQSWALGQGNNGPNDEEEEEDEEESSAQMQMAATTVEQKMTEFAAFCQFCPNSIEHGHNKTLARTTTIVTDNEEDLIKKKMRECLAENDRNEQLIEQNVNFCVQRARLLLSVHAQLRPISLEDIAQFEAGIRLSAQLWREELRNAVCSHLVLLKALGAGERKKRQNFSAKTISILNKYFMDHLNQPYPDEPAKMALAEQCGITLAQVSNWFGNKRIRFRKAAQSKKKLTGETSSSGSGSKEGQQTRGKRQSCRKNT